MHAHLLMQSIENMGSGLCRAGRIVDHIVRCGIVCSLIHTDDQRLGWRPFGRSGDDDFLGSSLSDVFTSLICICTCSCRFEHTPHTMPSPIHTLLHASANKLDSAISNAQMRGVLETNIDAQLSINSILRDIGCDLQGVDW